MKKILLSITFLMSCATIFAQGISISTDNSNPDASAILDVKSTTQGMLVPRLTTAQRDAVASPATGLLVFDTDMSAFYFYNGTNWINLSTGNLISGGAGSVYLTDTTTNFGVGTTMPNGKMVVVADSLASPTDPVFEVRNKTGQTIFAVYNEGVRIYVDATSAKPAEKGGFAVGGYIPNKGILPYEFLRVTQDSVRVYIDENTSVIKPAEKGGFAVGGFNSGAKASGYSPYEFLRVTQDSVRIYIDESTARPAEKGGFAVGGYNSGAKNLTNNSFLRVTPDSTRVFVGDSTAGFGITNIQGGSADNLMDMTAQNYFIGHQSGQNVTNGIYNSTFGYETAKSLTSGDYNTFIGYQSGKYAQRGDKNTFIGYQSGAKNFDGYDNTFIGTSSGGNNKNGHHNSFIGSLSGYNNSDGYHNTFVGASTGYSNTSGFYNTFLGYRAGYSNTTAGYNTIVGFDAGYYNTTSQGQVFLGYRAGHYTTGQYNTFLGNEAGYFTTTGTNNVFVGIAAGRSDTTGSGNAILGSFAGYSLRSGDNNTLIGTSSGGTLKTGVNNVFVGYSAGLSSLGDGAGSNNIFIGYYAGQSEVGSNRLYIENSSADKNNALIYGEFDNNILQVNGSLGVGASPNSKLHVNSATGENAFRAQINSATKFLVASNGGTVIGTLTTPPTNGLYVSGSTGIGRLPATNKLEIAGDASKTTAGSWLANSDRRIKTDIRDIENATQTIMSLHPVMFKYTDEWKQQNPEIKDQYYYNFIAQEYQSVFPESVKGSGEFLTDDKNEILQIDSYNSQIVAIKAIQELVVQNRQQEQLIQSLLQKIADLEKQFNDFNADVTKSKTKSNPK